ncbi:TPA: hypothetical protein ACH3X2_013614 [Trebouxia sp. C0005]
MEANSLGSLAQLEGYFESRGAGSCNPSWQSYIVWQVQTLFWQPSAEPYFMDILSLLTRHHDAAQDVLDNNVTLRSDTVVHVWKWWPVAAAAVTNHTVNISQPHEESTRLSFGKSGSGSF